MLYFIKNRIEREGVAWAQAGVGQCRCAPTVAGELRHRAQAAAGECRRTYAAATSSATHVLVPP
jgi:hypothetical protein